MCKSPSSVCYIKLCISVCLSHVLASSLLAHCVRNRCETSGKQPTFALSLIFWPNTKDIATSVSFFSLSSPSLLPLAPSSSFSCFWNGNKKSPRVNFIFVCIFLYNASTFNIAQRRIKATLTNKCPSKYTDSFDSWHLHNFVWLNTLPHYREARK